MRTPKGRISRPALHEAGHAAVGWMVGYKPQKVTIIEHADGGKKLAGSVTSLEPPFLKQTMSAPELPEEYKRNLVVLRIAHLFAGMAAELKDRKSDKPVYVMLGSGMGDFGEARKTAADYCQNDKAEISRLLDEGQKQAVKLVDQQWPQIVALAKALDARKEIVGEDAILDAMYPDEPKDVEPAEVVA